MLQRRTLLDIFKTAARKYFQFMLRVPQTGNCNALQLFGNHTPLFGNIFR